MKIDITQNIDNNGSAVMHGRVSTSQNVVAEFAYSPTGGWSISHANLGWAFEENREYLTLLNAMYAKADYITEHGFPEEQTNESA